IVSGWKQSPEIEFDVDPTVHSYEIARGIPLDGLSRRTREDGLLIVERRWTVEDLEGEEILDALAWCHGHLARLVAGAHEMLVDERAKYLMGERLAAEVERLGADQLIFCGEVWETPLEEVGSEEPQRREAFLTYALSRGGQPRCWRSEIHRDADDAITLGPSE